MALDSAMPEDDDEDARGLVAGAVCASGGGVVVGEVEVEIRGIPSFQ
jgi:hypothetical protein